MNEILIDQEALKKDFIETINAQGFMTTEEIISKINNAKPVDTSERETEAYKKGYVDGMIRFSKLSNDVLEKLVRGGAL